MRQHQLLRPTRHQALAQPIADRGNLLGTPSRGLWPLPDPQAPVVLGRVGIPRDDMDVEMGHLVAEHEAIDMLGSLDRFEGAPDGVDQPSEAASSAVRSPNPVTCRFGSTIR